MKATLTSVKQFLSSEDGPTSVEYCFMMGFILAVCVASIGNMGTATDEYFHDSEQKLFDEPS